MKQHTIIQLSILFPVFITCGTHQITGEPDAESDAEHDTGDPGSIDGTWAAVYETDDVGLATATGVIEVSDTEYVIVGHLSSALDGSFILVAWIDINGNVERSISIPGYFPVSITKIDAGGFIISAGQEHDSMVFALIKMTNTGEIEWFNEYVGCIDHAWLLPLYEEGLHYAVHSGPCVLLLDADGIPVWSKELPDISVYSISGQSTTLSNALGEGFIVAATVDRITTEVPPRYTPDIALIHFKMDGNILWSYTYGSDNNEGVESILLASSSDYIIVGETISLTGLPAAWIFSINESGSFEWQQTISCDSTPTIMASIENLHEQIVISGRSMCIIEEEDDGAWLVRLDLDGTIIGQANYGGIEKDKVEDLLETSDDGLLLVGSTESYSEGHTSIWIMKTTNEGALSNECPEDMFNNVDNVIETSGNMQLPYDIEDIEIDIDVSVIDFEHSEEVIRVNWLCR